MYNKVIKKMKKKEKARKCFYEIQFQSLTTYKKVKINILY